MTRETLLGERTDVLKDSVIPAGMDGFELLEVLLKPEAHVKLQAKGIDFVLENIFDLLDTKDAILTHIKKYPSNWDSYGNTHEVQRLHASFYDTLLQFGQPKSTHKEFSLLVFLSVIGFTNEQIRKGLERFYSRFSLEEKIKFNKDAENLGIGTIFLEAGL